MADFSREDPNTHYMMLHWGILPQLTTEVVPQGLDTIKTSHKEVNTSPMGVQQHTMIIYIIISSEVTNTSALNSIQQHIGVRELYVLNVVTLKILNN